MKTKICLYCKKEFQAKRSDAKCCSTSCRSRVCTERKGGVEALEKLAKESVVMQIVPVEKKIESKITLPVQLEKKTTIVVTDADIAATVKAFGLMGGTEKELHGITVLMQSYYCPGINERLKTMMKESFEKMMNDICDRICPFCNDTMKQISPGKRVCNNKRCRREQYRKRIMEQRKRMREKK